MELSGDELETELKTYLNMGVSESNPVEVQQHEIIGTNAHYYIMSKLPKFAGICMWAITSTLDTANDQAESVYLDLLREAYDYKINNSVVNFAIVDLAVVG